MQLRVILSSCTTYKEKKLIMHCTVYRIQSRPCTIKHCLGGIATSKHLQSYVAERFFGKSGTDQKEIELLHGGCTMLCWVNGVQVLPCLAGHQKKENQEKRSNHQHESPEIY